MAGDWIKMRVGLSTNPRVMRLAECLLDDPRFLEWSGLAYALQGYPPQSEAAERVERYAALRVTRYVTVAALLRFWGYANEHIKGEFIAGIFPEDVDEITGIPGFSDAIQAAGWAEFSASGGLTLPNFSEHNTSLGARSSASERQKRYREKRKANRPSDGNDNDDSVTSRVTGREEKNREEKKEEKILSVSAAPKPDDVPAEAILAGYRELLPDLPQPRKLDPDRKKKIIARWREDRERQSLDWWRNFWAYVAQSDFLTGRDGKWQSCNLDWLLEPKNMRKVTEGNYENRGNA